MGIVRNLFGDDKRAGDQTYLLEKVEVAPGLELSRALAAHWDEIEKGRLPFVAIAATRSDQLSVLQSSFGYYPALPKGYDYPKDSFGRPLYPLAQINFSEVPALPGYPTSGYLQFYISGLDTSYGMDHDNGQLQKDFRVLFFEEHEVEDHMTDFSFITLGDHNEYNVPVNDPYALTFSAGYDYMGETDVRMNNLWGFYATLPERYPDIAEELDKEIWEHFSGMGHKIGGYAFFTEADVRSWKPLVKDYILLLQIDTDEDIMWGDAGVGNFFIHPDDLVKKDFSKVLYNWDCA